MSREQSGIAGEVVIVHGRNNYRVAVDLEGMPKQILCHLSGKMRQHRISVIVGDKVRVEVPPPFDKGRIVFRER